MSPRTFWKRFLKLQGFQTCRPICGFRLDQVLQVSNGSFAFPPMEFYSRQDVRTIHLVKHKSNLNFVGLVGLYFVGLDFESRIWILGERQTSSCRCHV
jgi:hypothetical protein